MDDDEFETENTPETMNLADVGFVLLTLPLALLAAGQVLLEGLQGVLSIMSADIDRKRVFERQGKAEIEAIVRGES